MFGEIFLKEKAFEALKGFGGDKAHNLVGFSMAFWKFS